MHNPGLYDEYKKLYGIDKPVIDFLEEQGEIQIFLDNVYSIVKPSSSSLPSAEIHCLYIVGQLLPR